MSGGEEWGPWIEHDGKGCPVPIGTVCHVVWLGGVETVKPIEGSKAWLWSSLDKSGWSDFHVPIIRYRIRKPRGLTILEELIADLPAPVGPKVDA